MISLKEITQRINKLFGHPVQLHQLPVPKYFPPEKDWRGVGLAVEDMDRDVTDEGMQLFRGLESNGYTLYGYNLHKQLDKRKFNETHIPTILQHAKPTTLILQDHREWDTQVIRHRSPHFAFTGLDELGNSNTTFKLTILKDAHQRPHYHRQCADVMGCHAWITYYHPTVVSYLASYVRPQHLIRTYHTIDSRRIAPYTTNGRSGCVISGAVTGHYPLRTRITANAYALPYTTKLPHPGYGNKGCQTYNYIKQLSRFKVSICTSSVYGYALRKIIESTAAGCVVVTDLSPEDKLPYIDDNLVRIHPEIPIQQLNKLLQDLLASYDGERQEQLSNLCRTHYNYPVVCNKLTKDIETLRSNYHAVPTIADQYTQPPHQTSPR